MATLSANISGVEELDRHNRETALKTTKGPLPIHRPKFQEL